MDNFSFIFTSTFRVPMMCLDNGCEGEYYEGLYVEDGESGVVRTYQMIENYPTEYSGYMSGFAGGQWITNCKSKIVSCN